VPATRLGAALSSAFHSLFPASNAIDGDLSSLCATSNEQQAWASVRVPPGTAVGAVGVYNRDDIEEYIRWLGAFDVWVGSSFGDLAVRCGEWSGETTSAGPYVIDCGGAVGEYVTVRQLGAARYLTIAELVPHEYAGPLLPPRPPPPPPSSCASLTYGKVDLALVSARVGQSVWCYHMDDTRADWVEQFGRCESFYMIRLDTGKEVVKFCFTDGAGECRADAQWTAC